MKYEVSLEFVEAGNLIDSKLIHPEAPMAIVEYWEKNEQFKTSLLLMPNEIVNPSLIDDRLPIQVRKIILKKYLSQLKKFI